MPSSSAAMSSPGRRAALGAALALGALALTACTTSSFGATGPPAVDAARWPSVLADARGETVNFYAYGGDETLNRFLNGYVADRLRAKGVTLNEVKITDTSDAINKVLGEKLAGKSSGGAVDAIWVNGENFATGAQARIWSCGWPQKLPNARYIDFADPAVARDFGVPVTGCEAVWQQADSALVYNSAKLAPADVSSISALFSWAKAHPGAFTYPALPDFTGSMAVRTILYDTMGGPSALPGGFDAARYAPAASRLWARLNDLKPALWRSGTTYPQSEDQEEKLFADGEISAFFTYGPGAVGDQVRKGVFPPTTRETVPSVGNIANDSFVGIPANAAHRAAALVLANLLQDPQTQLALYKAEGTYPGIDLTRTDAATRAQFTSVPVPPSVLPLDVLTRHAQPELASAYVTRIEQDWKSQVLQK